MTPCSFTILIKFLVTQCLKVHKSNFQFTKTAQLTLTCFGQVWVRVNLKS